MNRPLIGMTMGDPAGVGPELCLRALFDSGVNRRAKPMVFGDVWVLRRCAHALGLPSEFRVMDEIPSEPSRSALEEPTVIHVEALDIDGFEPAKVSADTGAASYAYINKAIDAALAGSVAAVTTAPINKEALAAAKVPFPGHTEIFAHRGGSERWCMMQYSEVITCTFVTVHVGYSEVPGLLTQDRILEVIELSAENLARIRQKRPKVVVCGLNPHAGEKGLFGNREEERLIIPAIERARERGIDVEGPLPPDTAFLPWKRETTDVFVCMYHDQGHIPVKALAFDSAVNTTLGLPVIRTSVDHGTALDIAWQGLAKPDSLYAAINLACRLSNGFA